MTGDINKLDFEGYIIEKELELQNGFIYARATGSNGKKKITFNFDKPRRRYEVYFNNILQITTKDIDSAIAIYNRLEV